MSISVDATSASQEILVITHAARGTGFMTLMPAKERDGKLVLSPREGESLKYVERVITTGHN